MMIPRSKALEWMQREIKHTSNESLENILYWLWGDEQCHNFIIYSDGGGLIP